MKKVRQMNWNDDFDYNSIGPLCDPRHLTPRNRARHRYIVNMMIDAGEVDLVLKIFAAHPYLRDEFGERLALAVREEQDARRNW